MLGLDHRHSIEIEVILIQVLDKRAQAAKRHKREVHLQYEFPFLSNVKPCSRKMVIFFFFTSAGLSHESHKIFLQEDFPFAISVDRSAWSCGPSPFSTEEDIIFY